MYIVRTDDGQMELNCSYPGLPMFYSTDEGSTWTEYTGKMDISPDTDMHFCTRFVCHKRSAVFLHKYRP